MKKFITTFFMVSAAIMILSAQSVFAYQTIEGGCLPCHSQNTLHNLHSVSCTACHPGASGNTPIPSANCIKCHPPANPGQCDLINDSLAGASHGQTCLRCHTNCAPTTTIPTTTIPTTTVRPTTSVIPTTTIRPTTSVIRPPPYGLQPV